MLENLSVMLLSVTPTETKKIMLEKQHYARLILAVFDALFHSRRHEYNIIYCISYKFRTGSHDGYCTRQLANLSSLTNNATEKQDIESNNQTFEYVNPH